MQTNIDTIKGKLRALRERLEEVARNGGLSATHRGFLQDGSGTLTDVEAALDALEKPPGAPPVLAGRVPSPEPKKDAPPLVTPVALTEEQKALQLAAGQKSAAITEAIRTGNNPDAKPPVVGAHQPAADHVPADTQPGGAPVVPADQLAAKDKQDALGKAAAAETDPVKDAKLEDAHRAAEVNTDEIRLGEADAPGVVPPVVATPEGSRDANGNLLAEGAKPDAEVPGKAPETTDTAKV